MNDHIRNAELGSSQDKIDQAAKNLMPHAEIIELIRQQNTLSAEELNEIIRPVLCVAEKVFISKSADYGPSWRLFHWSTILQQMSIKLKRMRFLLLSGNLAKIEENDYENLIAVINYSVMGRIQLSALPDTNTIDIDAHYATNLYDEVINHNLQLMEKKNHDYNSAWLAFKLLHFVDFMLVKINRVIDLPVSINNDKDANADKIAMIQDTLLDCFAYATYAASKIYWLELGVASNKKS